MSKSNSTKEFKDFDQMMMALSGLTYNELKGLKISDPELNKLFQKELEGSDEGYGYIFACFPHDPMVKALVAENDIQVITHSIFDGDDDITVDCFATGFHFVNRERYYFCRSREEAFCEEEWD